MSSDDLFRILGSGPETALAEDYASVVDFIGRMSGAVEDGNLHYAWEKSKELRARLESFEQRLEKTVTDDGETYTRFTGGNLDGQKAADAAIAFSISFGHRAGPLLHSTKQIKNPAARAQAEADQAANRSFRTRMNRTATIPTTADVEVLYAFILARAEEERTTAEADEDFDLDAMARFSRISNAHKLTLTGTTAYILDLLRRNDDPEQVALAWHHLTAAGEEWKDHPDYLPHWQNPQRAEVRRALQG